MPKSVPTPVSVVIGLVPAVVDRVRQLPTKAVQLPILALSSAMSGVELARKEYDELSARGERVVARLRGTTFDEVEDRVEDLVARTPLAGAYDKVEDALEDVVDGVRSRTKAATRAKESKPTPAKEAKEAKEAKAPEAKATTAGKSAPTPKATEPDSTRIDSAATPAVLDLVEEVAAQVEVPSDLSGSDLPLADYDHLTLGALRGRLRSLDVDQLVALRSYEKSKADRLPVVTMLDNRIAKLAAGQAQPSGGVVEEPSPKASAAVKPPKKLNASATAPASATKAPPHTKVRST